MGQLAGASPADNGSRAGVEVVDDEPLISRAGGRRRTGRQGTARRWAPAERGPFGDLEDPDEETVRVGLGVVVLQPNAEDGAVVGSPLVISDRLSAGNR